jgi:hypothetical protein
MFFALPSIVSYRNPHSGDCLNQTMDIPLHLTHDYVDIIQDGAERRAGEP